MDAGFRKATLAVLFLIAASCVCAVAGWREGTFLAIGLSWGIVLSRCFMVRDPQGQEPTSSHGGMRSPLGRTLAEAEPSASSVRRPLSTATSHEEPGPLAQGSRDAFDASALQDRAALIVLARQLVTTPSA